MFLVLSEVIFGIADTGVLKAYDRTGTLTFITNDVSVGENQQSVQGTKASVGDTS